MSAINDGGPAFPEHHYFDPGRGSYGMHMTASNVGCGGMSLRDWFAGQVLAGAMVNSTGLEKVSDEYLCKAAEQMWRVADAMLKARTK